MEINRGVFLLVLVFFLLTPSGNPPRLMSGTEREVLHRYVDLEEYQYGVVMNGSTAVAGDPDYTGYGNLTGLAKDYNVSDPRPFKESIIPGVVYNKSLEIWNKEAKRSNVFVKNISSTLRGTWTHFEDAHLEPLNITIPDLMPEEDNVNGDMWGIPRLNKSETTTGVRELLGPEEKVGNMSSYSDGYVSFSIFEHANITDHYNVSLLSMEVALSDANYDHQQLLTLRGVHWKETGNILLTTNSLKFSGFYALPHFLLPFDNLSDSKFHHLFNETRGEVLDSINRTITAQLSDLYFGLYEQSRSNADKCEYMIYGHLHSLGLTEREVDDIEEELRDPKGRPHSKLGDLKLNALLYSPDCGQSLLTTGVSGEKYESFYGRMRSAIMCGIALLLMQTVAMAIQMKDTNTPSTVSKISFFSIALMALLDGSICMSSLVSSFLDEVALPFMAVAFVSFSLTSLFEMRYMVLVYRSQMLESVADARAREATNVAGEASFVARPDGTISTVSNPATQNNTMQNNSPVGNPADQQLPTTERPAPPSAELEEHQVMGMIYSRFYFTLLGFLLVTLTANAWPKTLRRVYEYIVVGLLYSIWVPQIYRNVVRGTRKSFLWKFVIPVSIIRYIPVMYLCLDSSNVLRHRYDPNLAIGIAIYLWLQVTLLGSQYVFGPRFFFPGGVLSNLYDYHPIITEEDLETGFDMSSDSAPILSESGEGKPDSRSENQPLIGSGEISVDCAICMNPVIIPMVPKDQISWAKSNPTSILARRRYMVTPCRHVYHTECMEHWMRARLQCPICRNPLPPI